MEYLFYYMPLTPLKIWQKNAKKTQQISVKTSFFSKNGTTA